MYINFDKHFVLTFFMLKDTNNFVLFSEESLELPIFHKYIIQTVVIYFSSECEANSYLNDNDRTQMRSYERKNMFRRNTLISRLNSRYN